MPETPLPPEFSAGPFTVAEAARAGIPPARLRRTDLAAPFRGVRDPGFPDTQLALCAAYAPRLRPGQVFSHESAAVIWGIRVPRDLRGRRPVHVMGIAPAERPRAVGVIGHRVEVGRVRIDLARGLPVVSAPDAWIQLAPDLSPLQLVEAGDSLIRRKDPLSSWPLIRAALDRHRGSRGIRRAVGAVGFMRAGTDSVRETRLRLILHRGGLPVPEVNGVIELGAGRTTHGDLVLRRWKVLVEYDGHQHFTDSRQYAIDVGRLEELAALGWTVIRVLSPHLQDERAIIARVTTALAARGWA